MTDDPDHELLDECPAIVVLDPIEEGEVLVDEPLSEADMEIVTGAHLQIMGSVLNERLYYFKKYTSGKRSSGLTNEDVYAFNALASGIEDNIAKQTKLKETHRKTTLLEAMGEDFSGLVQELHKSFSTMEEDKNEPPEYVPSGNAKLNKGELIKGNDEHTYDGFREENGMND